MLKPTSRRALCDPHDAFKTPHEAGTGQGEGPEGPKQVNLWVRETVQLASAVDGKVRRRVLMSQTPTCQVASNVSH